MPSVAASSLSSPARDQRKYPPLLLLPEQVQAEADAYAGLQRLAARLRSMPERAAEPTFKPKG